MLSERMKRMRKNMKPSQSVEIVEIEYIDIRRIDAAIFAHLNSR